MPVQCNTRRPEPVCDMLLVLGFLNALKSSTLHHLLPYLENDSMLPFFSLQEKVLYFKICPRQSLLPLYCFILLRSSKLLFNKFQQKLENTIVLRLSVPSVCMIRMLGIC